MTRSVSSSSVTSPRVIHDGCRVKNYLHYRRSHLLNQCVWCVVAVCFPSGHLMRLPVGIPSLFWAHGLRQYGAADQKCNSRRRLRMGRSQVWQVLRAAPVECPLTFGAPPCRLNGLTTACQSARQIPLRLRLLQSSSLCRCVMSREMPRCRSSSVGRSIDYAGQDLPVRYVVVRVVNLSDRTDCSADNY